MEKKTFIVGAEYKGEIKMKVYELTPTDGRASFYGKARVIIDENSVETLVSYNTPIMRRLPDGKLEKLWDG